MHDIWTELAGSDSNTGPAAYAKMAADVQNKFSAAGYGHQVLQKGEILADYIAKECHEEV